MLPSSLHLLVATYPFVLPIAVGLLAEALKITRECIQKRSWKGGFFRPGGMPSSHAAFVASLVVTVWSMDGLRSSALTVAVTLACLTLYDAVSSRHAIGEHAKVLNRLQKNVHLPERVGHSVTEVIVGALLGGIVTYSIL